MRFPECISVDAVSVNAGFVDVAAVDAVVAVAVAVDARFLCISSGRPH